MLNDNIKSELLLSFLRKYDYDAEKSIEIADKIMKDYFYEGPHFDVIKMNKNFCNWDYQHTNSANTYQLYLHCLNTITLLTNAYIKSEKIKYLKKAYKILRSWQDYNRKYCSKKRRYAWVDHSASFRIFNIMYFYLNAKDKIGVDDSLIVDVFNEHLDFLDNYSYMKDNHGIMLDRSLLVLSFFIVDEDKRLKIFNKSYFRLREAFFRDFSKRGVHLENSTDYHSMTKNLFIEINTFLKEFNLSLGEEIDYFIEHDDYFNYAVKPNHFLPLLGDSGETMVKKCVKNYDNFVDTSSGVVYLQNEENNLWLSFICGYSKINHKHYDDCSISLFYKDSDIFIDAGKYNYDRNDKIREYIISTKAHNTISIEKNYQLYEDYEFLNKPYISSYYFNHVYDLVSGINFYNNGFHKRYVIYIKPDVILIYDKAKFDESQVITQNYNLAPSLIVDKSKNELVVKKEDKVYATVIQLLPFDEFVVKEGDTSEGVGVVSTAFNKIESIKQIKTTVCSEEGEFLTCIFLGDKNDKVKNIKISNDRDEITYNYNEKKIQIYLN